MKRLFSFLIAIALIVLLGCAAPAPAAPTLQEMSASDIVGALVSSGFPIEKVVVYDESSDTNGLLGRPGQYIEKVSFADSRIEQYDESDPLGGTIEIFSTKSDCEARRKYIQSVFDSSPLFAMYMYQFGTVLARFEYALTPSDAAQYESALFELYDLGVITPVSISVNSTALTTPSVSPSPIPSPSASVESAIDGDFRNVSWGMSVLQVKEFETSALIDETPDALLFSEQPIAGLNATVFYKFIDGSLCSGMYSFVTTHTNDNLFIDDYNKVESSLIYKYGDPSDHYEVWKDDLFKDDPQYYGLAVSSGSLSYASKWDVGNTTVIHRLSGDNYSVSHVIVYSQTGTVSPVNTDGL